MNAIVKYTKFAARLTGEMVVTTGAAGVASVVAAVVAAETVMRVRADRFVAREMLRSDSPWNTAIEGELA